MDRRRLGLRALTLLCIVVSIAQHVVADEVEEGDCYLDKEMKDGLICTSDVKTDSRSNLYLREQTYCSHKERHLCMTCIDGTLLEVKCQDRPNKRHKRWWSGRRSSRSGPPPNHTPSITCPSIPATITAPPNSVSAVVTWGSPRTSDSDNNIKTVAIVSGQAPGSRFSEGKHTVSYKVTDTRGASSSCSKSFTVRVIRCPAPPAISNGLVQCDTQIGTVYGTRCTYTCNSGYEISGSASIQCQNNGHFTSHPTCRKISCGNPPLPKNAKSVKCPAGHLYQSVCSPVCEQGYLPGRGSRLYCSAGRVWQPTSWICEDEVAPVFHNCPTKTISTIDRNFRWAVTATDNSGIVTAERVQGHPPGTPMEYGIHHIKYVATDPSGNKAYCDFVVELRESDCPIPTSDDKAIRFSCNGMAVSSVCQLSCASKTRVEGSEYIACVRDKAGTTRWESLGGGSVTCHKASCPTLNTPKNGALACDKQQGQVVCQIQCNDPDVMYSQGMNHTFACDETKGEWHPRAMIPDCEAPSSPAEYYLPTDFHYHMMNCPNPKALGNMKKQFINSLNFSQFASCRGYVCSVEDVDVTCGGIINTKGVTGTNTTGLHIRVNLHIKNSNRTLLPNEARNILTALADKFKEAITTNMRYDLQPTVPPAMTVSYTTGNLNMVCDSGYMQIQIGKCVPCSIGSYADKGICKTCPQNTYQNKSGSTSCKPCPAHHTTLSTGAVSRDECLELCNIDEFSPTGRAPCFPCPDEEHQPQIGSTTCLPCPGFHIVGPVSLKCLYRTFKPKNDTVVHDQFRVSRYLLACQKETCLEF